MSVPVSGLIGILVPYTSQESTAKDEALDATEEQLSESRQPRSDRN
jgi:hypothetical protein